MTAMSMLANTKTPPLYEGRRRVEVIRTRIRDVEFIYVPETNKIN